MKNYKAVGYYLYVRLLEVQEEETSEGGIITRVGDTKREQKGKTYAEVISIGEDCWSEFKTPWCKEGDVVNIAQYGGQDCEIPDGISQEEKTELSRWKAIRDIDVLGVKQ